jgi:hypothetical protein
MIQRTETFTSSNAAILAVEAWAEEARARGDQLEHLFAVLDIQRESASVAYFAPRRFFQTNPMARKLPGLRDALRQKERNVVRVFAFDKEHSLSVRIDELAAKYREMAAARKETL